MKFIVKKYYQIISNNRKILCQLQKKIFNFKKTKQNRLIILSNCAICAKKKSSLMKNKQPHNFDWRQMYAKNAFKTSRIYL